MHPRTDPVVIILTVSPDNNKILLGRNVRIPSVLECPEYAIDSALAQLAEELLLGARRFRRARRITFTIIS